MTKGAETHNSLAPRLLKEIAAACHNDPSQMAVIVESLLLGVAMFALPLTPRAQAQYIQEIADGASDRVKVAGQ